MRIAGSTIRRNYLSRYEKNYGDKYDSEKKIYSGRQFDRGSENPINAAKALRIRRSQAEVETYQANLKTADSIYTMAETSMLQVSSIIQNVYEKLVEGAHGTRNQDDLNILATEIDNYAEEMVQSMNIDVADRKVFGGLNNDTVAFKIETSAAGGDKFVTYNGVAVNSSNDPQSYPYNGTSYLDIGIGMSIDGRVERIDDQTALPITFNGAECTGCGMTNRTSAIDLTHLVGGTSYTFDIYAGGISKTIEFTAEPTFPTDKNVELINDKLKEAFNMAPELQDDGSFKRLDNYQMYSYGELPAKDGKLDISALQPDTYYSMKVTSDNKTRVVNFLGGSDINERLANLDSALKESFGEEAYADGSGTIHISKRTTAVAEPNITGFTPITSFGTVTDADGNVKPTIDLSTLVPGETYAINVNVPRLGTDGKPMTDENGDLVYDNGKMIYFTAGADPEETKKNINSYVETNEIFGNSEVPYINDTGTFAYDVDGANIIVSENSRSDGHLEISDIKGYAKNIMQLVLDAGSYLRKGDQQMVARYADLIYAAQSNLSMAITDLGTHSKFIEFNEDRINEIQINLNDKQNDIESTDLPTEITKWKVLESVYNASLQMGASILSQTIFNYIS